MRIARRSRPGALGLLVMCLAASALIRLGAEGQALAEDRNQHAAAEAGALAEAPRLLEAIRLREAELDAEQRRLQDWAQTLAVTERRIRDQIEALEAAQQALEETIALADRAAERDLDRMTAIYETMRAANAARVFETMDLNFAAGFLARMRADSAADILSAMSPERAYAVSVVMAGRNAGAPRD